MKKLLTITSLIVLLLTSLVLAESSDKPNVELFVFSKCPYGLQAEKGITPVFELLDKQINSNIRFIHYFWSEEGEEETYRQVCIREEQSEKYLDYLMCYLNDGDSERCLNKVNINKSQLDTCVNNGNAEAYYEIDSDLSEDYGVRGSPTLIINGEIKNNERSPAAYLDVICSSFDNKPIECSEEFSNNIPAPGFGWDISEDSSDANCGDENEEEEQEENTPTSSSSSTGGGDDGIGGSSGSGGSSSSGGPYNGSGNSNSNGEVPEDLYYCPQENGYVGEIPDQNIHDSGPSGGGDSLEIYCRNNVIRLCLSKEPCPWRNNIDSQDQSTCIGNYGSNPMANSANEEGINIAELVGTGNQRIENIYCNGEYNGYSPTWSVDFSNNGGDFPNNNQDICSNGCEYQESCIPFGYRLKNENNQNVYCEISKELKLQKENNVSCQNSFECLSGQCTNERCINLQEEMASLGSKVDEGNNILQEIIDFLRGLFWG